MGIFDGYKSDQEFEKLPIINSKQLLNTPFVIEKMNEKKDWDGQFGKRDVMIVTLQIVETGERFTWFAENSVVKSKLEYLKGLDYCGTQLKLIWIEAAANGYYDLIEA